MSNYVITCCSTVDLNNELMEKRGIPYTGFHYSLNDEEHVDDMGKSVSMHDFYQAMADGASTHTSQVTVGQYEDFFRPFLEDGKDIIHATLSSGISGSYNSALLAKEQLQEEYPERKITIIDSLAASSGYGMYIDALADYRDEGHSYEETVDFALNNRQNLNHLFYSTTLEYFIKGGRISKTSGVLGGVLGICPVMHVTKEGKLEAYMKPIGVKRAIKRMLSEMERLVKDGHDYDGKVFISHSDVLDQAQSLASQIEAAYPKIDGKVQIFDIGTTIGAHTGPGTVALFFWGKDRED